MSLPDRDDPSTAHFARHWLEQRPDLDPQVLMLELTLGRLNLLAIKSMDRIAARYDISAADYLFMIAIGRGRSDAPLRPSALSRLFGLQPSVVTYRLNQLAERELVDRNVKPDDRRVILLSLTPRGAQVVADIMTALTVRLEERLRSLDGCEQGRRTLQLLLDSLLDGWERLEAQEYSSAAQPDSDGSVPGRETGKTLE